MGLIAFLCVFYETILYCYLSFVPCYSPGSTGRTSALEEWEPGVERWASEG